MYAISLHNGKHFFKSLAAAKKFQKKLLEECRLTVSIYKRVENHFTGFVHFEKIA